MTDALHGLEHALQALAAADAEVFVRETRRLRIELTAGVARVARGLEEGTAVRLRGPGGELRFGASSGASPQAALAAASIARALPPDGGPGWGSGGPWMDLREDCDLPGADEGEAWLRRGTTGGARAHLDAATTVEVLGSHDGLRACRVRATVWARLLQGTSVRSAVAERLEELDPADWAEPAPGAQAAPPASHDGPIALLPAAAGGLVPALIGAVHVEPLAGVAVGPGWVCEDEGGAFDDTGFPSGRLRLADGKTLLAAARGAGRRRRASYRTPPAERFADLHFPPTGAWDGKGLLARSARPLPAGDGTWWTVLEAAPARDGSPLYPWAPWVLRAEPARWAAQCRAGVGKPRRTPEGITVPTLVFEGLPPAFPLEG